MKHEKEYTYMSWYSRVNVASANISPMKGKIGGGEPSRDLHGDLGDLFLRVDVHQ